MVARRRLGWSHQITPGQVALIVVVSALATVAVRSPTDRLSPPGRESAGWRSLESPDLRMVRARRSFVLPLNNPPLTDAAAAAHMRPEDIVVGVVTDEGSRAYPRWLLVGYHVANDTIGGNPVLVALCEECSGAAAFVAAIDDEALDFRICGIRDGTFEICDFQTGSRWHPFTGVARSGQLQGCALQRLPVRIAYWEDWVRTETSSTVVLGSSEQRRRPHGSHALLGGGRVDPFLARGLRVIDPRLPSNTLVFGLLPNDTAGPVAVPVQPLLRSGGLVQFDHGDVPVAVVAQDGMSVTALDRRLDGNVLDLSVAQRRPVRLQDALGNVWDAFGRPIGDHGRGGRLAVVDGYVTEWYEWASTAPGSSILDLPP